MEGVYEPVNKKNKKYPKLSYAILKGIEKYPNDAHNIWITAEGDAACAIGGALGYYHLYPSAIPANWYNAIQRFREEYNIDIYSASDGFCPDLGYHNNDPIPRDMIAGMLIAIGE